MEILTQVRMMVEIMNSNGPTGEFAEVLELRVEDFGDNVIWSGPVERYHPKRCGATGPRPVKIVATKLGKRSGCTSSWQASYHA